MYIFNLNIKDLIFISLLSPLLFFFFLLCVDHRDLHSFPTRRSSDLSPPWALISSKMSSVAFLWGIPQGAAGPERGVETPRSEEHTSELQSHVNLVCRLLLEKKNVC